MSEHNLHPKAAYLREQLYTGLSATPLPALQQAVAKCVEAHLPMLPPSQVWSQALPPDLECKLQLQNKNSIWTHGGDGACLPIALSAQLIANGCTSYGDQLTEETVVRVWSATVLHIGTKWHQRIPEKLCRALSTEPGMTWGESCSEQYESLNSPEKFILHAACMFFRKALSSSLACAAFVDSHNAAYPGQSVRCHVHAINFTSSGASINPAYFTTCAGAAITIVLVHANAHYMSLEGQEVSSLLKATMHHVNLYVDEGLAIIFIQESCFLETQGTWLLFWV